MRHLKPLITLMFSVRSQWYILYIFSGVKDVGWCSLMPFIAKQHPLKAVSLVATWVYGFNFSTRVKGLVLKWAKKNKKNRILWLYIINFRNFPTLLWLYWDLRKTANLMFAANCIKLFDLPMGKYFCNMLINRDI